MKNPFSALQETVFKKLYFSQTNSLLGDAFTWVGIALLAFQFGGKNSAIILSTALTLRATAFILFGPYAGVLADRIDRKKIMYITHFVRMAIVGCLPFVTAAWQIYILIFLLNIFNAFLRWLIRLQFLNQYKIKKPIVQALLNQMRPSNC